MINNEFTTMREIGKLFGATSHEVGKWLVEIGLRTPQREPSQRAREGGFCARRPLESGYGSFDVWHQARTVAALEQAGHRQVMTPPPISTSPATRLVGPFTLEQSGINGFLIRDGDGVTVYWAYGEVAANKLVRLLNLAYQHGYFK